MVAQDNPVARSAPGHLVQVVQDTQPLAGAVVVELVSDRVACGRSTQRSVAEIDFAFGHGEVAGSAAALVPLGDA